MSSGEEKGEKPCCISHEFFRSAVKNPTQIAVIHASGGLQICKESSPIPSNFDDEQLFNGSREASSPLVYHGDECFTYGDILSAVDSLSHRIRCVLDGGDDPGLVSHEGYFHGRQTPSISDLASDTGCSPMEKNGISAFHGSPNIVGVYMVPSVEYIVAVLSILRCGESFLPLDPLWPEERILSIVSSSKTVLIIKCMPYSCTDRTRQDEVDWFVDRSDCSVLYLSMKGYCKEHSGWTDLVWPCESRSPRKFCYLMYTSGSTGMPKGVCGTEKGLLNRFLWLQEQIPLSREDILLFKTSISFVDHLQEFLSAILTCTTLIVPPFDELKANSFCIVNFLKAYCVSRLISVPSLIRALLPAMESSQWLQIQNSLKVLVLSGETLPISLWKIVREFLPKTTILNLYGSTEVSGDCTYFDCKSLPKILETETISSVPIGVPISNCGIILVGEPDKPDEGEVYVGGACLFTGYFGEPYHELPIKNDGTLLHFRTGDFARRLQSGDLVFLGRKDRTIKVNGHRVALEEIENTLREHPDVCDAAVTFHKTHGELSRLEAYIVLKSTDEFQERHLLHGKHVTEGLIFSIRSWLVTKLPLAMIPSGYFFSKLLPMSTSGKIDYSLLASSTYMPKQLKSELDSNPLHHDHLQIIKEAFCDALLVEKVTDHDDFFMMGGTSISAAHAAYKLGIDMRLLYIFSSPIKLLNVLLDRKVSHEKLFSQNPVSRKRLKVHDSLLSSFEPVTNDLYKMRLLGGQLQAHTGEKVHDLSVNLNTDKPLSLVEKNDASPFSVGPVEVASCSFPASKGATSVNADQWISSFDFPITCSFSRCNKFSHGCKTELNDVHQACLSIETSRYRKGRLQELWRVLLKSCVDASPLVVLKDGKTNLFIGSHSHIFLCIDAFSGHVRWEVKLEGRIECSAAITGDFSQVVVGCYKGKIYFLDFLTGSVSWAFQTDGEVKMQPVVDKHRNLIWCGSHDHWLYALDYKKCCCVYKTSCGGSIYGSPSLDMVRNMIYVASTSGRVTAISIEVVPFCIIWLYESGAPIFGFLSLDSHSGNVICCLVDGHVIALNSRGAVVWKMSLRGWCSEGMLVYQAVVGGPIFAGACISSVLPSQVLICSRSGSVFSFDMEGGLLWEYQVGNPITSSAYVDEHTQLISEYSNPADRLACICSSSGSIHVLRINPNANQEKIRISGVLESPMVQQFALMDLPGDIFSSPVMIGGRIFVGCRDDYVHCITVVP